MWISEVLLPVLFLQTSGCAPVPPPPVDAAGPPEAPPPVDGLHAAIAIAAAPTSTPRFLSFIQTPPYHDRPEDPERSPVGPLGSVRMPARNRHRRPARSWIERASGEERSMGRGWRCATAAIQQSAPGGAQVAAEAMTYDRDRRTDCNTGRSPPGKVSGALHAHPRVV